MIGNNIKQKYSEEFKVLKKPYMDAVLDATPKQLHKMQEFSLQFVFSSDGWFILHCLKELVSNGKLNLPTEEQKAALSKIIIHK